MGPKVDVYVYEPEVGINPRRGAVFIQFQVMDGEAQESTARSHTVLMPVPDAMQLLQTLQHIQKRFSLPEEAGDLAMIEIPQKKIEYTSGQCGMAAAKAAVFAHGAALR